VCRNRREYSDSVYYSEKLYSRVINLDPHAMYLFVLSMINLSAFVRKVYFFLSAQLAVTVGISLWFINHTALRDFARNQLSTPKDILIRCREVIVTFELFS
jgi:FtsH-binding integral membrane protein